MLTGSVPLVVLLSVCYLAYGQQDSSCQESNIKLLQTCPARCISFDVQSGCYSCRTNCSDSGGEDSNNCSPLLRSPCDDDEICLSTGIVGQNTCVELIGEGEVCGKSSSSSSSSDDDDDRDDGLIDKLRDFSDLTSGISERDTISSIERAEISCRRGLVCRRESLDRRYCRLENQTACNRQRLVDREVECDEEGNYRPVQCKNTQRQVLCRCVSRNGTEIEGTEKAVSNRDEAPDCEDRRCSLTSQLGVVYRASSGTSFIDYIKCSRCLCAAGEPTFCVSLRRDVCNRINPAPKENKNCAVRDQMVKDGASISIGCTRCRCNNGKLQCLRRVCEDDKDDVPVDEEDRKCTECRKMPASPVCGNDGKTYPSLCVATKCRGLNANNVVDGPCNKKDVCLAYLCNRTEICLRRGGVTCLSKSGCRNAQRFRTCVNLQKLRCRSNSSDDSVVCGSDGTTYSSTCHLLQTAAGVKRLYGDRCDDAKCSGGTVCGTDGVTYSNICELQAQSANARVDYRGECTETTTDGLLGARCKKVRANGKCRDVSDCKTVIRPRDGCCPICGGGIAVGFDRDSLEEYLTINPSVETVDDLMVRVFLSGLITKEDQNRCVIRGSLLSEGDLFIAFEAKIRSEDFCMKLSQRLESVLNNPPRMDNSNSTSVSTSIPQELQFALVAESSALVSETPTVGGGQTPMTGIFSVVFTISLIVMAFIF